MSDEEGDFQGNSGKRKIKRWTEEEHELLVRLVEQLGEDACWATIAEHIPGRTGKQCRERWVNHIGADIKKGGWSMEEEAQVARLHATIGPAWTRIANALGGRTENSVKNHFNALLRSKRLDDKKTSILAQYVRLVREKIITGIPAYEQAVLLTQNALAASSGNTNSPSSKSRPKGAAQASQGSAGGARPLLLPTADPSSPGAPSYNSAGGAGLPSTGTPMSGMNPGDPSAALAAAAAAVQAVNTAMGMTDSAQFSGQNSPGLLGSLQTGSVSLSASLGTYAESDQIAIRGMRRTGRGGRGRPGYGHMPTLRDARSGSTPTTRDATHAAQTTSEHFNTPARSEASQQLPGGTPVSGSGAPFTPSSRISQLGRSAGGAAQPGGAGWLPGTGTMLHAAHQAYDKAIAAAAHPMGEGSPLSARGYTSVPRARTPPAGVPAAGLPPPQSLMLPPPPMPGAGQHHAGAAQDHSSAAALAAALAWPNPPGSAVPHLPRPHATSLSPLASRLGRLPGTPPGYHRSPLSTGRPYSASAGGAPHELPPDSLPGTAGTSANSLTIGLRDVLGGAAFPSVFGSTLGPDTGSPMSPGTRGMAAQISNPLGTPLFSHLPTQASLDLIAGQQHENEGPLLGRLSGLSLEAFMASPMSARTPSASALYFIQGAAQMRAPRPERVTLMSQPQVMLSPFHNQDAQDRSAAQVPAVADAAPAAAAAADAPPRTGTPPPPGCVTDELGLVMKPLHVKTKRDGTSEAGAGAVPGSQGNQVQPGSYLNSLNGILGIGSPSMHQVVIPDMTPTARMLGEVFMSWTQEPHTPSHILISSPHYPVAQVMAGALANNPQLRGPSEGVFNTMPSLVMLQPDAAPGAAQSNLPEVAVPPSDQMGHLEIVFDEAPNASAPPAAHAAAYRSQSMPQQPVQPLFGSRGSQGADVPAGGSEGGAGRSLQAGAQERSGGSLWPQPSLAARPSMDVHAGLASALLLPVLSAQFVATQSPGNKRSSAQVFGDTYSPGHSAAKRKGTVQGPGTDPAADPGTSMQHSGESSGTPLTLQPMTSTDLLLNHRNSIGLGFAYPGNRQRGLMSLASLDTPTAGAAGAAGAPLGQSRLSRPQRSGFGWDAEASPADAHDAQDAAAAPVKTLQTIDVPPPEVNVPPPDMDVPPPDVDIKVE